MEENNKTFLLLNKDFGKNADQYVILSCNRIFNQNMTILQYAICNTATKNGVVADDCINFL